MTTYKMNLTSVAGGSVAGFTYFCCWPCVCDTQDFIRVDTKTIVTAAGPRQYHFLVIGNPCNDPQKVRTLAISVPFPDIVIRTNPHRRCRRPSTKDPLGGTRGDLQP